MSLSRAKQFLKVAQTLGATATLLALVAPRAPRRSKEAFSFNCPFLSK